MLIRHILYAVFCCCVLTSCHAGQGGEASDADSLVVVFTGDVMLDRGVRPWAETKGVAWLFEYATPLFRQADAAVVNLECPLTDTVAPLSKRFVFRADTRWAKDMRKAGVTHAALANNHTNDQGLQGFASTVRSLRQAGVRPVGCVRAGEKPVPTLIRKGSLCVAVFNAVLFHLENWTPDGSREYIPWQTDIGTLCRTVSEYSSAHPSHRVVCVLHWGVEYDDSPNQEQVMGARMLASAGASTVVGHHPHVIQPMRMEGGIPVAYSLGNFVFDSRNPLARRTQAVRLVVRADTLYMRPVDFCVRQCRPVQ